MTEPGKTRDSTRNDRHLLDELPHSGPFLLGGQGSQQTL